MDINTHSKIISTLHCALINHIKCTLDLILFVYVHYEQIAIMLCITGIYVLLGYVINICITGY